MSGTVLILGASGRFGRHAAEAFWNAGWRVRIFDRHNDDLMAEADGADVVVNAWNPPYTSWKRDVPELTAKVIAAAKASGATVIIPGNVYGRNAPALLTRDTPHAASNQLGRIRIDMEAAYRTEGVKTIVLRSGDYIDNSASGNWFDMVITAKLHKGHVVAPGDADASHAWAYLPDKVRAAVALAEMRDRLDTFEEVLFPGFTLSLTEMADLVSSATGRTHRVKPMSWLPLWLAAPLWPMGRRLLEMRYLWSMPHRLDCEGFQSLLPQFRNTDPLTAIGTAVSHLDIDPDQSMPGRTLDIPAE